MKKIISTFFVVLLSVVSIFGFSACSCAAQVEEIDVSASLTTQKDYLLENVYNQPAGTDFNVEGEDYVEDENYYVTIKTGVVDIFTSMTISDVIYEDDDTVSLSVGNNNFIIREAWKLEEGSLMVASGLLLSSTDTEGKVSVLYGDKELLLTTLSEPTEVDFDITVEGTGATITGPTVGVYTYTSDNYAGFFKIGVTNASDESLLTANSIITVEKIKKDTNGDVIGITYAITTADDIDQDGEYELVFYPAYNAGEAFTSVNPPNYTMEFRFLVIDVGADSFTFDFVNSAT
ncbi:MAG: hypothetical protein PHS54_04075 [Clostridia bacterium]|nr:hypothetical protein [Clostridia bacterium]